MGRLIYASNMSLDGWTEDAEGGLDWAPPDDEVFVCITELMASAGTYLYGRRMYETMAVWETDKSLAAQSGRARAFAAAWTAADKLVWSTTLRNVPTARTRLERQFDPVALGRIKEDAAGDLIVGGPTLAAQAFAAGLVDECQVFVWPVVLAGRKPALDLGARTDLVLLDERRFGGGAVRLRYRVTAAVVEQG